MTPFILFSNGSAGDATPCTQCWPLWQVPLAAASKPLRDAACAYVCCNHACFPLWASQIQVTSAQYILVQLIPGDLDEGIMGRNIIAPKDLALFKMHARVLTLGSHAIILAGNAVCRYERSFCECTKNAMGLCRWGCRSIFLCSIPLKLSMLTRQLNIPILVNLEAGDGASLK